MSKEIRITAGAVVGLVVRGWIRDQLAKELRRQGAGSGAAEIGSWVIVGVAVWAFQK